MTHSRDNNANNMIGQTGRGARRGREKNAVAQTKKINVCLGQALSNSKDDIQYWLPPRSAASVAEAECRASESVYDLVCERQRRGGGGGREEGGGPGRVQMLVEVCAGVLARCK